MDNNNLPKYLFSAAFALLAIVKVVYKDSNIDATTALFVFLIFLPWISSFIKEMEIPTIGKITLQDVSDIDTNFSEGGLPDVSLELTEPSPSYLEVLNIDPNLALAGYRIEIEKRIQKLGRSYNIKKPSSLSNTLKDLAHHNVITEKTSLGYQEILKQANKAVHGAKVDPSVVEWIQMEGKKYLDILDLQLLKVEERDFSIDVGNAKIILKYHGQEVVDAAKNILVITNSDQNIVLSSAYLTDTPKSIAKNVLVKIGALIKVSDLAGNKAKYEASGLGNALYRAL